MVAEAAHKCSLQPVVVLSTTGTLLNSLRAGDYVAHICWARCVNAPLFGENDSVYLTESSNTSEAVENSSSSFNDTDIPDVVNASVSCVSYRQKHLMYRQLLWNNLTQKHPAPLPDWLLLCGRREEKDSLLNTMLPRGGQPDNLRTKNASWEGAFSVAWPRPRARSTGWGAGGAQRGETRAEDGAPRPVGCGAGR